MKNSKSHAVVSLFFTTCFLLFFSSFVFAQDAEFVSSPSPIAVSPNDTFQIVIQVQINDGAIDGAEAHLNFDPALLKVNGITRLSAAELPTEIVGPPTFNNTNGTIDYVAGALGGSNLNTDFDFIQIDFEAIGEGSTTIAYNYAFPRPTKITGNFNNVLSNANDVPVTVAAANENPIASFTATPNSGTAALFVAVDANASNDPDGGTIVDYAWDFGDLNTATGITSDNNYTNPGTYTITLTVTDNNDGIGTATENIVVSGVTIPTYNVTASAGLNGSIDPVSATVDEGGSQTFTITADAGYEVADVLVQGTSVGAVTTYELTNVLADTNISASFSLINADSTPEITLDATASVNEGGNISVPLLITDADGDALTVSVTSLSNEPQELQSGNGGTQVDPYPFDASGFLTENITNNIGGIYSSDLVFAPNFGDGGSNGDGSGDYTVTVTVTDTDGNTVEAILAVTVNDTPQLISDVLITTIQAESYDNQGPANAGSGNNGIGVEDNTPGGGVVNIGFTTNGDFAEYLIDVATAGTYSFDFFVGKDSGAVGTMTINGGTGEISVNPTGGWQTYTTANTTVTLPAGQQTLRFDWSGPNGFYFNMDSFAVTFLGGVNAPPSIDAIADVEVDEGETVAVDIQVNDDNTSPMIVSIEIFDKSVPGGTNNPFTPAETLSGYSFTDNGSGSYTLSWVTDTTDGRSYEARVTADDTINLPVIETFTIDVAQDISDLILARTFSSPLPWYGGNPQAPFTVAIETAGNIGWIDNNEFVEYLIDVPQAGDYNLSINAAKGNTNNGLLTVSEENAGGFSTVGSVTVVQTGWGNYEEYTTPVTFTNAGVQTLRFDFSGGMNISDFQFTSLTGNTPPIVEILTPNDGLSIEEGVAISFTATAEDSQDDDVATSLVWNSDLDGDFGTGATVNTSTLSLGTHIITATATDNDPTAPLTGSTSITVSIYQTAPNCDVRYRVNAGGALFVNSTGNFTEDQAVSEVGGTAQAGTPSPYINLISPAVDKTFGANVPLVSNTTGYPDFLFQTERYSDTANPDNMKWTFPTGDGIYDVKILFNENWTGEINNPRVFDVEIEGVLAFDDYRPSGPSGADVNVAKVEIYQATVIDGELNINFIQGTQNPAVKGFDICFVAPIANNAPVVAITAPTEGATVVRGTDIVLSGTASDEEDGDISASLAWSSSDIQFTTAPSNVGASITGQFTTPGAQTLRASVTDSDAEEGFDEITVNVSVPEVKITDPSEDDIVSSTDVTLSWIGTDVLFDLTEHYHIFVNPPDVNNIDTDTRISTAPQIGQEFWNLTAADGIVEGENTIVIRVANQFHEEFTNPEAQDIVTFTVCSTSITEIVSNDPTDCSASDGTLVITATGTNLEYSINGGTDFFATNSFSDLAAGTYDIVVRKTGTTTCTAEETATLVAPESPSITEIVSNDPTDCSASDGTLVITATGTDLEYSINGGTDFFATNSFSDLAAGTYEIVVREAGTTTCTAEETETLVAPESPSITEVVSNDPTDCSLSDGALVITATGTDLEYSINGGTDFFATNSFSDLAAGTYEIVVREAGTTTCTAEETGTLVAPESPSITEVVSNDPTDCSVSDGTLVITATGTDLEYSINGGTDFFATNSFSDLAAGTYDIVVREAGTNTCTAEETATLVAPESPSITEVVSNDPTDCSLSDGTLVITATGTDLEYSINGGTDFFATNSFSDLAAGTYDIVVREAGTNTCTATDTLILTAPEAPSITSVEGTDPTSCGSSDGQLIINATGANLEYSIDNGSSFESTNTFGGLLADTYNIVVREVGTTSCTAVINGTLQDPTGTTPIITGPLTYLEGSEGVTLDAGAGFASYLWSPGGETTQTITVLEGTYSVTVTETNGCEGTSIGVVVTEDDDTMPPEAICQDITVQLDATGIATITAGDIDNGSNDLSGISGISIDKNSFDCSDIGANTVKIIVIDNNGNSASCTATVTVEDTVAPVISCMPNINILSSSSQVLDITLPTATDNCENTPEITFVRSDNNALGLTDSFPQGETMIQWTATDASGNTDICVQTVTITLPQSTDNEILVFSVNGQVGQETIDSNAGTINLTVALGTEITSLSPSIVISDLASISPDPGIAQNFSAPVNYEVTAEDNSTKQWTISITVEDDTTDPEISCPDNIVVNNDAGTCGAIVTYAEPVGSDNAPGVTTQQIEGLPNGQVFPVGVTTQTYLVEDEAGNSVSCSFTVTVIDSESPIINCPTNVSVTVAPGTTSALVNFDAPSVSDNCLVADLNQTAGLSSGSLFPLGTTVNTFQVTDGAGNTSTCSFEVTVEEEIVNNVLSVTSFTLVDADTDTDLFTLTNGMTIDINSLPTIHLDVRANTTNDVESVSFILSGAQQRTGTESVPPYALYRDTPTGNYLGNDFTTGAYTLTGTPFSGNSANGNAGTSLTIGFELVDGDPDCLGVDITVQATSDPTTCGGSDGSILLSVSGTTGILDYDWGHDANLESGNATGLSAGSYTVTVSDANGCTKTVSANLVDPSSPSVSLAAFSNILATASPITLSGGLPAGGTYSGVGVNNGVFNPSIGPGTYTITYSYTDATSGCGVGTATRTITVTPVVANSALNIWNANTDTPLYALVDGLKIQKSAIGSTPLGIVYEPGTNPRSVKFKLTGPISRNTSEGRAPYSLYGDIGVDIQGRVFPVGAYTLVVTPTNRSAITVNFEIIDIDPICAGFDVAVQSTSNPTVCNGSDGSVALAITGGAAPFLFDWNHDAALETGNAAQLSAGSYTVTVSDLNGCTKTVSVNLVAPSSPSVSLAPYANVLTTASPITLSGGLPTGGTYSGVGVNNGVFDPSIGAGTYTITYSYTNPTTGCSGSANRTISVTPEAADSGLTILNANTDTVLYALVDGLQIQKADIGNTPLGIVFDSGTNPRSVKFTLTGPLSRNYSEGRAPFSLYGDIGIDIQGRVFPIGFYTLVVKPNNAPSVTVNFSIVQGVSNTAKVVNNMSMSPNPAIDRTTVSFGETVQLTRFFVYDTTGRLIKTIESETGDEVESMELSVYDLPIGVYFVRTTDTSGKEFQQQMIIKD